MQSVWMDCDETKQKLDLLYGLIVIRTILATPPYLS